MKTKFGSVVSGWMGWVVAATLVVGAPAFAQSHGGGMMMWQGKHLSRMLDSVQATPAQRQEIQQIAQNLEPQMKEAHQAHRALMEKSMQLLATPVIDESAIEQNRLQLSAQHDQQSKLTTGAIVAMAKVLTPQQRAQIAARMQKRMSHRGHHDGSPNGAAPASVPVR